MWTSERIMKALIDADWFAYAFGNATDDEYKPLAWPFVKSRIDGTIRKIIEATGADEYQLYVTSNDKSNFRFEVATIKPYKGNRPTDKPYYYDKIRDYLIKGRGAIEVFDMEADDAVSIEQTRALEESRKEGQSALERKGDIICSSDILIEGKFYTNAAYGYRTDVTIICSIDKDLDNVTGYHYNWMKEDDGIYWIDELDGLKNFYCQLLTGDTVDNIPGLFGVGKSSKLLSTVNECNSEYDMYSYVLKQYERRLGSYADQFLLENARLLWMLKTEDDVWEPPINKENSDDNTEIS